MLALIDESGTHTLNADHIDRFYSVFVLGAVIFSDSEYEIFDSNFKKLKRELFGTDEFIIHTAEITRPSKSKHILNRKLDDPHFRKTFYSRIVQLIEAHSFSIATCVVKKKDHFQTFGVKGKDPYIFSFECLLNSILTHCNHDKCEIFPEKRTYVEDTKLELSYLRTKVTGTEYYRGAEIAEKVKNFELLDKRQNISGLQLADLIVTPIGRNVMGKVAKPEGNEVPFFSVKKKIAKGHFYIFPQ